LAVRIGLRRHRRHEEEKRQKIQEVDMRWTEIREQYPDQWLIIDALEAHTEGNRRKLDQMTVVEVCSDGAAAFQRYHELHQQYPMREFYFVHTAREELDIRERYWLGLQRNYRRIVR
jgi:hypothetical protein